jgi:murein DD-endopeptidase MepM/ murein hydrolase activator NlpD
MTLTTKALITSILVLLPLFAFSEKAIPDTLKLTPETISSDSATNDIDENIEDDNATDSLIAGTIVIPFDTNLVPAAKIYPCWNNAIVNPYKTSMVKMPDTVSIDLSGYVHPFNNYITSPFGWRRYRYHYGMDIKLQIGDSLKCAFDGMIRIAKRSKSFGNYIVVRHNNGLETIYGHMSKILVNVNQTVKSGQIIGLGGSTGHSTGPHLHFEVRYLGNNINPNDIIDFANYSIKDSTLHLCQNNFAYLTEIHKVKFHYVRNGETLSKIARRYGMTVETLCKLNKISTKKKIRKGQRLRYS